MSSRISTNPVNYATGMDDSSIVQCLPESGLDLLPRTVSYGAVNTSPHLFQTTPKNMPQATPSQNQPCLAASNDNDEVCNISLPSIETEVDGFALYVFCNLSTKPI